MIKMTKLKKSFYISLLFMLLICVTPVFGVVTVQISTDNATWVDITDIDYNGVVDYDKNKSIIHVLDEGTVYYISAKNETSDWGYTTTSTLVSDWFEGKMLAIVIGLFIGMLFFGWMGYSSKNAFAVKIFGYGISLLFLLDMFFLLWANEVGESLASILRMNFYIMLILSFAIGFVALAIFVVKLMLPEPENNQGGNDFSDDSKWVEGTSKW